MANTPAYIPEEPVTNKKKSFMKLKLGDVIEFFDGDVIPADIRLTSML